MHVMQKISLFSLDNLPQINFHNLGEEGDISILFNSVYDTIQVS